MSTTKVTTDVIDMSGNAGGLTWVKGTTAQRTTTTIGDLREDTDTKRTQVYTDETGTAEWRNLKEAAVYTSFTVDYLVVAGGGSGASYIGGGGGAGGLRTSYGTASGGGNSSESALQLTPSTNYTITIGPGGTIGTTNTQANDGSASSITGSDITDITTVGGGGSASGGGSNYSVSKAGGSGGGGGSSTSAGSSNGGAGETNQGYAGGNSGFLAPNYPSAGGGGAFEVGESIASGSVTTAAAGGDGLEVNIIGGTGNFYAGGGGGSIATYTGGVGGSGGGGNGATYGPSQGNPTVIGTNGGQNKGGGGGGGSSVTQSSPTNNLATAGGSGIVILRCTKATATIGAGITVNGISAAGSVSGVAITGTSDYYYSATSGTGTITFS